MLIIVGVIPILRVFSIFQTASRLPFIMLRLIYIIGLIMNWTKVRYKVLLSLDTGVF